MINILELSSIRKRQCKALYGRNYYNNNRNSLMELLGNKCVKCGFSDIRALQIDHKIGSCIKDRIKFKNDNLAHIYYLKNPIFALNNLQILCANCNWIKRSENNEIKKIHPDRKIRKYTKGKVYIWEK